MTVQRSRRYGTGWGRDAEDVAVEISARLDELDAAPPDLRLRYEDLASDLAGTARLLSERLAVDLDPAAVDRPAQHVTTSSVAGSIGRWKRDLTEAEAAVLEPVAERLGY